MVTPFGRQEITSDFCATFFLTSRPSRTIRKRVPEDVSVSCWDELRPSATGKSRHLRQALENAFTKLFAILLIAAVRSGRDEMVPPDPKRAVIRISHD
jgi:hypothetical protein